MTRHPIESSNIRDIAHEGTILEVTFKSGKRYRYLAVPPEDFAKLMAAESKGSHFASAIKPRFDCAGEIEIAPDIPEEEPDEPEA